MGVNAKGIKAHITNVHTYSAYLTYSVCHNVVVSHSTHVSLTSKCEAQAGEMCCNLSLSLLER